MIIPLGVYKIKCVKQGGYTLKNYGQKVFAEGEEIDLLDANIPETLRAGSWQTANDMCTDTGFELAQLIAAGYFVVTEKERPDLSLLQ